MQMYHHSSTQQQLLATERSGSHGQLWRRTWTPANSDMTDRETEYADSESDDGAHSSDSEYVDSEFDDAREEAPPRVRPIGKRAPDSPTTFTLRQKVWIKVKGVWYLGQVKHIVIDRSSTSVRLCPMYEVYFRNRSSTANMKAVADPLKGDIKPDTPQFRAWLVSERIPVGSNWEI